MALPAGMQKPVEPIGVAKPKPTEEGRAKKSQWKPRCEMCNTTFAYFDPTLPMRCNPCAQLIIDWDEAPTWPHLLLYNRDFIEGGRSTTPYSMFPLYTDKTLHPGLLRLHDYGILVIDAQPEYHKVGQEENGKWFELKERAYLRCVVPTEFGDICATKVEAMLEALISNRRLETVAFYEYADYFAGSDLPELGYRSAPPICARKMELGQIPRNQFFRSSVGPSLAGRTVTKHRCAESKEELKWTKWKRCKHNRLPVVTERDLPWGTKGSRAFGRESKLTIELKPVVFMIAVRDWADTGVDLAATVVDACTTAGLEPIFEDSEELEDMEGEDGEELPVMLSELSVD